MGGGRDRKVEEERHSEISMSCAIIAGDYSHHRNEDREREEGRDRFLPEIMMMMAIVKVFSSPSVLALDVSRMM
jgi:hypothetical protein